ncbi:MAG TPA: hypothetical protein VFQ71_01090 [Gaiellales bacterium]|jgi:hypothetical protein|nr:hypothetical protein [Gaiellales bacterium]
MLFWTIVVIVVVVVAVVVALNHVNSGAPPKAASSPGPPTSANANPQATASVVKPPTSDVYLSDLKPFGNLAELVVPGPVTISGSIYPKSVSFYCNVGDPTPFPKYTLEPNARRFQATIGLPAASPPQFQAGAMLIGDGRTLRTFSISVHKPRTVEVNVKGVHTLQLECFGAGNSATGGEAVGIDWGNARIAG